MGITADAYGGFVKMTNSDDSPIEILAGSKDNGFQADTGNLADLLTLGMNEVRENATGSVSYSSNAAVDGTVLQASDGLKINGVEVTLITKNTDGPNSVLRCECKTQKIDHSNYGTTKLNPLQ